MSLPGCRQRTLAGIEQTLVAEDPGLGLRFAVFTRLTRHEAMPGIEQVQSRRQRLLGPAIRLPLMVIGLVGLLAGSWLIPGGQACPVGASPAVHGMSTVSRGARCQPRPAVK